MPVTINGSNTPTAGGVTYGDGTQYATTAAGSAGGVLYSAGSSAPAFTAAGTSGQVLTSAGAGAPSWTTPSAGAMVFISSQTVSSTVAAVDFTSGFSSTYDDYVILFEAVTPDLADSLSLRVFRNGSVDSGGNYWYQNIRGTQVTASASYQSGLTGGSDTKWNMTSAICAPGNVTFGKLEIYRVNSTNPAYTVTMATLNNLSTANSQQICGSAFNSGTGTFSGLRFYWSAGQSFTGGTFRLYGIAKS